MAQPPPPIDRAELQQRALQAAQQHVDATLEGVYRLEALTPTLEWSPIELRQVFELPLVVWRAYGTFEVLLDDGGRPVGFIDSDKWLSCAWRELEPAKAEGLARSTTLVAPDWTLGEQKRGEKDCLELLFVDARGIPKVRVRLNPARQAVISVLPVEAPG